MKYLTILIILFSATFTKAQVPSNFEILRSKYYAIGLQHSIANFDNYQRLLIQKRAQQKISESDFLRQYDSLDFLYKKQHFEVADIAAKWAVMAHQRPSKLIKNTLTQVQKGKYLEALNNLQSMYQMLNVQESDFLQEMNDFGGKTKGKLYYKSSPIKDSLSKVWNSKDEPIGNTDSQTFVRQRIYIAHRYYEARDTVSAIGTMLLAQEINDKIKSTEQNARELFGAAIAFDLANWQLQKSDVNNAYLNALKSYELYQALQMPYLQREKAASTHLLASVFRIGGAMKESDSLFNKAIESYQLLSENFPEYYKPILAQVLQEHALVLKYFDKYDKYDANINQVIAIYKELAKYNYPYFTLVLSKNYTELGNKRMNTDVKIFLAQEQWANARIILEPIYKNYPLLLGDELCTALYKLGGSKIALKEGAKAIPFFEQSLNIRGYLYQLAPSRHRKDYLDVLTQNATLNALDKRKDISISQLEKAIIIAKEMGQTERANTIEKFKKDVETH